MGLKMIPSTKSNIRVIFIVVLLCYPAVIDSAAVILRSEELLQRVLRDSNTRIPRAMENNDEDDALKRICHTAPCGWLVYKPHTRDEVDFMRSPCVCPNGSYKCVRVGDNLSVNAYVYRCRQNTTANDIEAPNKTTT